MVEWTIPLVLDVIRTIGIVVGIIYYITIMRNSQRNQEISLKNQELTLQSQELTRKAQEQAVETRQAQLFMQILSHFNTPSMVESRAFYYEIKLSSIDDYNEMWSDPEKTRQHRLLGGFLEGIGTLVRMNYIDIELIVSFLGGVVKYLWEKQAPYVIEYRERFDTPRLWIEWEYLYEEVMSYGEKHPELGVQDTEYSQFETQ